MLIDLVTFLFAFVTLLMIHIPQPVELENALQNTSTVWKDIQLGFRYINNQMGLRALTGLFMVAGVFLAIGATLMAPLVLNGSHENEPALATVQSIGAVGGIVGGVLLSLWGGTKRRIHTILIGGVGASLLGVMWLGLSQTILMWSIGSFFFAFFEPYVEGGNIAIWQTEVPVDIQGRVFSARHLLVQIPYLFGILGAGFLAEAFSISLVMVLAGLAGAVTFASGYAIRSLRNIESMTPNTTELA
jgi:hypothetical protein